MNKKRSCFIVKDGKGNVKLYYTVKIITARYVSLDKSETDEYTYEDDVDINVFDLYEQNQDLQHQLEEKDKIIKEKNECLLAIAKETIEMVNWLKSKGMNFDNESWINELEEILERGKNEK